MRRFIAFLLIIISVSLFGCGERQIIRLDENGDPIKDLNSGQNTDSTDGDQLPDVSGGTQTFRNSAQGYVIEAKTDLQIENLDENSSQIKFYRNDTEFFIIRTFDGEDREKYLDQDPVGEQEMAGIKGQKYIFKDGYCMGENCYDPMIVVEIHKDGKNIAIEFYNVTDFTDEYLDVINNMQLIEK